MYPAYSSATSRNEITNLKYFVTLLTIYLLNITGLAEQRGFFNAVK